MLVNTEQFVSSLNIFLQFRHEYIEPFRCFLVYCNDLFIIIKVYDTYSFRLPTSYLIPMRKQFINQTKQCVFKIAERFIMVMFRSIWVDTLHSLCHIKIIKFMESPYKTWNKACVCACVFIIIVLMKLQTHLLFRCVFFAGWAHSRWGRDNCKVGVSEQVRVRHRLVHFLTREQKCQFTTLQHIEHMSLSAHSAAMLNIYTHTHTHLITH